MGFTVSSLENSAWQQRSIRRSNLANEFEAWLMESDLGRILLVPSLFSRLSSVFGRLQNPALLLLSSKNGRFRRPSNLLLLELEGFADFERILVLMCFLCDNLASEPRF